MKRFFKFLQPEIAVNRVFGLDILRAFAILLVVLGHSFFLLPPSFHTDILSVFPDGVAIFFVLSGYLIGRILIKMVVNNGADCRTLFYFWTHRWLRTLPVYFFILILLCLLSCLFTDGFRMSGIWKYFIFCQNFNTPQPAFFSEVWSLSVEECFYLLIPAIIFILIGRFRSAPEKAILGTIFGVVVLTILVRFYRYATIPVDSVMAWDNLFRRQVVTRMDNLMFGVAGAYLSYYHRALWRKYRKFLFIMGLGMMVFTKIITARYLSASTFYYCNISFLLTAITILLLLPFLGQLKRGKGVLFRFITYTSLISYSMYLTHVSLIMFFIIKKVHFLQSGHPVVIAGRYFLYWGLVYLISLLLYKYFELPFMALRLKIRPLSDRKTGAL